jgi:hypothetical protein
MNCIACGSELQTHEYQSRSADEAHTTIITCDRCPIDAMKLNPGLPPPVPYRGLRKPIKRPMHVRVCSAGSRIDSATLVTIDIPKDHAYSNIPTPQTHVTVQQKVLSTTTGGVPIEKYASMTIQGPLCGMLISESSKVIVGMGAALIEYGTYTPGPDTGSEQRIVSGEYATIDSITDRNAYVYIAKGSTIRKLIIELREGAARVDWGGILNTVMCRKLAPSSCSKYIPNDTVMRLSNLSARAWDATVAPTSGHVFTSKPDGERMWLMLHGHTWYMVPPKFKGRVRQWHVAHSHIGSDNVIVLDVEYLGRHGMILIDVLTTVDGTPAPVTRDMNWVINQFRDIDRVYKPPRVNTRQYFRDYKLALEYAEIVPYPVDGIVAIRDGSTEILKVKSVKSMELEHTGNGNLASADGTHIASSVSVSPFDVGSIIEVRFTVDKTTRSINVTEVFQRSDKTIANATSAVVNIVSSAITLHTKDDNDRRAALIWCNELRKTIHKRAFNRNSNNVIILDVGSGNGQSLDSVMISDKLSYVFVEPDEQKCKALARRTRTTRIFKDPLEMIPTVRSLKTRLVGSVILNCTLSDIVNCEDLTHVLLPELRCVLSTFSMHFVVDELQDIRSLSDVPIYGCGYLYDNVNEKGTLVNSSGVVMEMIDDDNATVKWGSDTKYTEPVTMTQHYAGIGKVVKATGILKSPDVNVSPGAIGICDKVYVLLP